LASGTATLEAGLIGLPHVIAYRMDTLTATIARHVLISEHVGLPNLVCQRRVCPEVLQDELTVPRLVAHLHRLWEGPRRDACLASLGELRPRLGGGGALTRIVDIVAEEIQSGHRRFTHATAADTSARLKAIR
jgi:lipid-A-disaccharide synthase